MNRNVLNQTIVVEVPDRVPTDAQAICKFYLAIFCIDGGAICEIYLAILCAGHRQTAPLRRHPLVQLRQRVLRVMVLYTVDLVIGVLRIRRVGVQLVAELLPELRVVEGLLEHPFVFMYLLGRHRILLGVYRCAQRVGVVVHHVAAG